MKNFVKKLFIPNKENNHSPTILQEVGVVVMILIAVAGFGIASIYSAFISTNGDFLALVLPRVLVDLANSDRQNNGLLTLKVSPVLEEAAQLKANHMAQNGYFAHTAPTGESPWHWFIEAGYEFTHAGENLAVNFTDSEDVESAWMNSPTHRENILNGAFSEIGIATAEGTFEGRKTVFVVQLFGRPTFAFNENNSSETAEVAGENITLSSASSEASKEDIKIPDDEELTETLEVVVETPTFVAVVDESAGETVLQPGEELGVEAVGLRESQSTFWEKLLTQPNTVLAWMYILLGAIIVLVLSSTIIIEIEKQHPKHIFYGLLVLLVLVGLFYVNKSFVLANLVVL